MFKKIALSVCFTLFLGLLSACSPEGFPRLKSNESSANQRTNNNAQIGSPVALPPKFEGQVPLKPGQMSSSTMPNGLTALKPAKGINVNALFSEQLKDENERFDRVENAVVDLRKEFDSYKPSIVRLAAVESDIQNLIKELEVLLQETPSDISIPLDLKRQTASPSLTVEQLNPEPKKPPEKIIAAPPKKKAPYKPPIKKTITHHDGIVAENLRAGEHADKVRLVIDTNKNTDFKIDLDNDEKLIIIELPEARWVGKTSHTFSGSKILNSYSVEAMNDNNGSLIIISLKKGTSIVAKKHLSPDAQNAYHRIYFDLKL